MGEGKSGPVETGLTGPVATALDSLSMTKLCCHLLCFDMLGILVHSACGLVTRVSNLKYESVRIGSKTVVFIRANPGKKETTDGLGSHVISFGIGALFRKW